MAMPKVPKKLAGLGYYAGRGYRALVAAGYASSRAVVIMDTLTQADRRGWSIEWLFDEDNGGWVVLAIDENNQTMHSLGIGEMEEPDGLHSDPAQFEYEADVFAMCFDDERKGGHDYAENPRKNVEQVMEAFARLRTKGHPGDSIWTNGDDVYSYNTCLLTRVQRTGTVFILNASPYSVTTRQQQNGIRQILRQHGASVVEVEGLDRGVDADDLIAQAGWSHD